MFNLKTERESVVVQGNVKACNIEEVFIALHEVLDKRNTYGLKLVLIDSICITSNLIGKLLKFSDEHPYFRLVVGNKGAYDLLEDLNLVVRLKVSYKPTQKY